MPVWKKIIVSGSDITELNNNAGYATTGSNTFYGNQTVNGDVTVTGNLTAQQYIVSSSVIYVTESNFSGSHVFGNSLDDTHQFTGSVLITGSSTLVGNQTITGSILMSGSATDAYISTVNWIDFNPNLAVDPPFTTGRLHWVDDTKTLGLDTDVNGSVIELGHQNVVRVVNQTGVTISKGRVVYISGSLGTRPGIATASYTDENDSATTLGFVMHDIVGSGGNTTGYVVTRGLIREVNTSGMTAGTSLYLSSSGQYSTTKPQAPLHDVRLGKVIVGGSTNAGVIYVDIQNGYEIDELHNVRIVGDTSGDLIVKSGSLWINSKTLTGSYTITGSLTVSGSSTFTNIGPAVFTGSVVSTAGFTGSLLGTASFATTARTASYVSTLRAAGDNQQIQFNSASLLSSSPDFVYDSTNYKLQHITNGNYEGQGYASQGNNSFRLYNQFNGTNQYANLVHYSGMADKFATKIIFQLTTGRAGGGDNNLSILGFKCDYCLLLFDDTYYSGTRVGTLLSAWDHDTTYTPELLDTFVSGDKTINELQNCVFTIADNGGDLALTLDNSINTKDVYYTLMFTIFTKDY